MYEAIQLLNVFSIKVNTIQISQKLTSERGPKLGKRALALLEQSRATKTSEITDLEELVDSAIADEDSGDRWKTSDLSKSLRFYQSAFQFYSRAIEVCRGQQNPAIEISECYYNALRLLFLVYNQYQGCDCLDIGLLASYPEVLQAGANCVIQDLSQILAAHENAIHISGSDVSSDLLYNTALVYTEIIETLENENEIVEAAHHSMNLLQQVFKNNVEEFQNSIQSSNKLEEAKSNGFPMESAETKAVESKTTQPLDIVDAGISMFNLFRTYIDSSGVELNQSIVTDIQSTLNEVDIVINELLNQFLGSDDTFLLILQDQKNEYLITREYARSTLLDFESCCLNWDNDALPETAERFMLAADSIQSFWDRLNLKSGSSSNPVDDPNESKSIELYWASLSKMNIYLKKAQEILVKRNNELKKATGTEQKGLGALVLQICAVYIARADIDQQRSRLQHSEGQAHKEILGRNVVAFLKNAIALSKQSGGIRETTIEKLQREKSRINAQVRLCILEGLSEVEISSQVKGNLWQEEYEFCASSWFYKQN